MGTFLLPGRTLPGKCIILADSATYILFLVHGHLSYPRYISNLKKRKLLQALLNPVSSLLFHDLFSFIVIFLKTTTNRIIHENFYSLVILLPPDPHTNHSLMTSPATPHPHHLLHFRPTFPTARTPLLFPASSILLTNWFLTFYIFFKNHLSWCNQRDTFLRERSNDINSLTTLCLLKISLIVRGLQNLIVSAFSSTMYYNVSYMPDTNPNIHSSLTTWYINLPLCFV